MALAEVHAKGGEGALELADVVMDLVRDTAKAPSKPKFLYELTDAPEV